MGYEKTTYVYVLGGIEYAVSFGTGFRNGGHGSDDQAFYRKDLSLIREKPIREFGFCCIE